MPLLDQRPAFRPSLYTRFDTYYEYSTRTHVLGFLVYFTYMSLSAKWTQKLIFKARRLAALDADSLLGIDRRPPSLLLRSFMDDLTPLTPEYELGRQSAVKVVDVTPEQLTLEEAVSDVLSEFGPVIAIGKPGEDLPPVGAGRQYVGAEGWLDSVGHFMTQARWIAVVLGNTEGLSVEYGRSESWARAARQ